MKYSWLKLISLFSIAIIICGIIIATHKMQKKKQEKDVLEIIAKGINENAPIFEGLYESLFQASQNHGSFNTDSYEEWCDRVGQLDDKLFCETFAQLFDKSDISDEGICRQKYKKLLYCISTAGIMRDRQNGNVYIADETMRQSYNLIDGCELEIGAEYIVMTSAWLKDNKIIEHGMLMRAVAI